MNTNDKAQGGGEVRIAAHWLENVAAAASLLEASGDVLNVREAAALRKLIASAARTAPPSAPVGVEWLCRVYSDAYHAGHHATVEGGYVDVLPVDRDTYWQEKVEEDYADALTQQPAAVPNIGVGVDVAADGVHVSVVHREGPLDTVIYSETHPFPPAAVDGAMVERAREAYYDAAEVKDGVFTDPVAMRAALTAALAAQPGGERV